MPSLKPNQFLCPVDRISTPSLKPKHVFACCEDFRTFIGTQTLVFLLTGFSIPSLKPNQSLFPVARISMPSLKPKQFCLSSRQDFHTFIGTQACVCPVDRISMHSLKLNNVLLLTGVPYLHYKTISFPVDRIYIPLLKPNQCVSCWQDFQAFIGAQTCIVFLLTGFTCLH